MDEVGGVGTKFPSPFSTGVCLESAGGSRAAALFKPTCHRLLRGGGLDVRGLAMSPPESANVRLARGERDEDAGPEHENLESTERP
jgi:hypothetical protein